jgi:predicted transcriptional regulator
MTVQLSTELAAALHACGDLQLEVVDPVTSRVYVLVESETHRQAMAALRCQQDGDAIAQGLAEMEAGLGVPLEHAFDSIRTILELRRRQL